MKFLAASRLPSTETSKSPTNFHSRIEKKKKESQYLCREFSVDGEEKKVLILSDT